MTRSISPRSDVHQAVTDRIIAMLDSAQQTNGASLPWCRPTIAQSRPTNAVTGQPYRGINIVSLWSAAAASAYRTGLWATYKQWHSIGAQVRAGERSTPIVFYKSYDLDTAETGDADDTGVDAEATRTVRFARGYHGFNADQIDGFPLPQMPTVPCITRLSHAETFFASIGVDIRHGGAHAFYRPGDDIIQMPDLALFRDTPTSTATEAYYAVLGHEAGHATGAKHRLSRDFSGRFGSPTYAFEELVAELTSANLCADLAITAQPRADHAHYIANWLTALKSDKTVIFAAAAAAHRAAEYLHGLQPDIASSASRQHFIDTGRYLTKQDQE